MVMTAESIDQAVHQLDGFLSGVEVAFDSDPTSLEMAKLFAVVATANNGREDSAAADWTAAGMFGGKSIVEKLRELITKLREALARLVKTLQGVTSFSIGVTGPVLSISINFGPGSD